MLFFSKILFTDQKENKISRCFSLFLYSIRITTASKDFETVSNHMAQPTLMIKSMTTYEEHYNNGYTQRSYFVYLKANIEMLPHNC